MAIRALPLPPANASRTRLVPNYACMALAVAKNLSRSNFPAGVGRPLHSGGLENTFRVGHDCQ
jgi:hypothetical protein